MPVGLWAARGISADHPLNQRRGFLPPPWRGGAGFLTDWPLGGIMGALWRGFAGVKCTMIMSTVVSEGNLIPADLLEQVAAGEVEGQQPGDFGFERSQRLSDEIAAAWSDARAQWGIFQSRLQRLPEDDLATSVTREFWVIPLLRFLAYEQVTFMPAAALVEGRTYALSHRAGGDEDAPPVHIVGVRQSLDRRAETGRPRLSPHALVQEYLNATEHVWGVVTNGERLRLLRDSSRMTRAVFVEFDLRTMLADEKFAEFALLYRLLHRSRLPVGVADAPQCLLERYHQQALEAGGRVRDGLREGVERALRELGNGLLQHAQNRALRELVLSGGLSPLEYYRQLLRLVYRLLFLMVAEERQLIGATPVDDAMREVPTATALPAGVEVYRRFYSITQLRRRAEQYAALHGGRYGDLWLGLGATFRLLENDENARLIGLSGLDGDLFSEAAIASLQDTRLSNSALLRAIHALSLYRDPQSGVLRRVNYAALDVEELGSVYESLLDYRPVIMTSAQQDGAAGLALPVFELVTGTERKTTGSYYTRPELVQELVKSALDPVIAQRVQAAKQKGAAQGPEAALLALTVCDPACGSGAFLLAAARRLGLELARVRTDERQPDPLTRRAAIRDVIAGCIYGVDVNPLAVDLCKLSLWIEGHNAGMPLSFLDSHIRHGNSLVGAWRDLVDGGIPDDAFKPVTGDVKAAATALRARNKKERQAAERGQLMLPLENLDRLPDLVQQARQLEATPDHTVAAVRAKAAAYARLRGMDSAWYQAWTRCNLWTAAFFLPLTHADDATIPTSQTLLDYAQQPGHVRADLIGRANGLASEMAFFHWELEFAPVFARGGFDVVLGNPPWERIKLQEQEHFVDVPAIRNARNKAEREQIIRAWRTSDNATQRQRIAEFERAKQRAEAESRFVRASGRYPLTAVGDVNTYALFAELDRSLVNPTGRAGIIVPTGIATDDTTKRFFGDLVDRQALAQLLGFENEAFIFKDVHNAFKFCALTMTGESAKVAASDFAFLIRHFEQIGDERRHFGLSRAEIALINPNTLTCPIFRTTVDAELTKKIYQRVPVLVNERTEANPWGVSFLRMFDMANDSHLFRDAPGEGLLPLYEAKLIWHFDHRFSSYENATQADINAGRLPQPPAEQKQDPHFTTLPRYWIELQQVETQLLKKWSKDWFFCYRRITSSVVERTMIATIIPRIAVNDKLPICLMEKPQAMLACCLLANLNSLCFDYFARQKVGGTQMDFFTMKQLPVLPPSAFSAADMRFIVPRVLELVYTAWDMHPFAADVWHAADESTRTDILERWHAHHNHSATHCHETHQSPPPPFTWDEERRASIRAELDAHIARLYGLSRDELRYILDPHDVYGPDFPGETFRVLKEKETRQHGEYRTKRLVLEAWDAQ